MVTTYREDELQLTADVLVIGGGPAAAWAAWAAAAQGVKVIIADKGFLGTSGAAAASGNGIMAPSPENWEKVLQERYRVGKNLANLRWIERVIEKTWLSLPLVESWGYRFPKENGESVRQSYYGPEYMRVMRKNLLRVGVQILDQSPALELLLADDGSVAGARGIQRQHHRAYTVRASAVVMANGGCAFLSKALGCNTNTGDGMLMAVEAGGELSSMEASNHYAISTAFNATVTRGVPFGWASYSDEAGNDLGGYLNGRRDPAFLPNALMKAPVYARLDKATPEVKAVIEKSHFIAFLPYKKAGIDPYTERVPVTLVLEGTVRGTGGIRIIDETCATKVPGLYAAGDAASREFLAGLASGGGGPNAAWAISTGQWAGEGAAAFAKSLGAHANERVARPTGQVGLRSSSSSSKTYDNEAIVRGVQAQMFPLEKNYLRSEQGLLDSLAKLESLWQQVKEKPKQDTVRDVEFSRRSAALTAVARWAYFSALHRKESRSEHIRVDYPETDPNQRYYQATGGLDKLWVRRDWITETIATPPVLTTQTAPSVSKS
ncbi:Fumarate reductase/succinate dehydrogenase flavoprotein-like protein [Nostoc sp. NIES-3756]|uniref:FAD-dependent oxidoreductase n=1 Tax=Nostoc sp. NIES-3756 TaxID=1751286 RepID=UPI00072289F2|nr:FAD-binding protein [Nostoc sp. NIES-3756]BAT56147.1 Fumarate reductase/succinate dehydrogenase flavoprotein-like protein [Nostoc sp. NIES-3756]